MKLITDNLQSDRTVEMCKHCTLYTDQARTRAISPKSPEPNGKIQD